MGDGRREKEQTDAVHGGAERKEGREGIRTDGRLEKTMLRNKRRRKMREQHKEKEGRNKEIKERGKKEEEINEKE